MRDRVYDFNIDGLADLRLVPDMLQDLKNLGMSQSALSALFSSAEGYVRTWERARHLFSLRDRLPQ